MIDVIRYNIICNLKKYNSGDKLWYQNVFNTTVIVPDILSSTNLQKGIFIFALLKHFSHLERSRQKDLSKMYLKIISLLCNNVSFHGVINFVFLSFQDK